MKAIGLVAALPAELAPLVRLPGWTTSDGVHRGPLPGVPGATLQVFAAATGMGAAPATHAFAKVLEASGSQLAAILSYGWAGAITCGVKPPDVYALTQVIDARTGERFETSGPPPPTGAPLRLVTLDHVAGAHEKRPLAERYQAVLVDMEAATIGRLARAHHLPFYCFKGISDGYTDILPDFNRFFDGRGGLRLPSLVAHALVRPRYWPSLLRLGRNSRQAASHLARQLPVYLHQAGLVS